MLFKFSKKRIISLTLTVIFVLLMLYANFYIVKKLERDAVKIYLYDRLLVAYEIGSIGGMKEELNRILSHDRMPYELALAKKFKKNLDNIKKPDEFLENIITEKKIKIRLLKHLRTAAIALIMILVVLRIFVNFRSR